MCGGMTYKYPNKDTKQLEDRKVYFPQPHAQIPVIGDGGEVMLYQWGRRSSEEDPAYDVPVTGWARWTSLKSDYWQQYGPEKVLIPALRFSEKGKLPKSRWFDMPEDTFLMGLKIQRKDKHFIYVVTNPAIGELEKIHPRMPLIVQANFSPVDFEIE
jgi:putative SOS response-associated peptidase YedK